MSHPDDEMAICSWIKVLVEQGAEVHLSWTHSNATREAEARAVAVILGIPEHRLHFMGAPDGRVAEQMPSLVKPFRELLSSVSPDRVVCCAYEQGHLDHDATNYLLHRTFDGPIFELPLYHTYCTKLQRVNRFYCGTGETRVLTEEERKLKIHVIRQYQSQNIEKVMRLYQIYCRAARKPAHALETEQLRLKTWTNYYAPNLPAALARRVTKHANWRRWQHCVRALDLYLAEFEALDEPQRLAMR